MMSPRNDDNEYVDPQTMRAWAQGGGRHLRTNEVAELLQVSPKTVSRWAQEGKLPFLRTLGGHRRYPEAEIRLLLEELRYRPGMLDEP